MVRLVFEHIPDPLSDMLDLSQYYNLSSVSFTGDSFPDFSEFEIESECSDFPRDRYAQSIYLDNFHQGVLFEFLLNFVLRRILEEPFMSFSFLLCYRKRPFTASKLMYSSHKSYRYLLLVR